MPVSNPAILAPVVVAGVEAAFADSWSRAAKGVEAFLEPWMTRGERQDFEVQPHGYLESAPHPERVDRGVAMPSEPVVGKTFDVQSYRWKKRTQWHKDDRKARGKVKKVNDHAALMGSNWARLPLRAMLQMIRAAADPKLLPAIPLTPDGTALFAAAKFGVAAGNIVAGNGVATAAAIQTDFFTAITQAMQFEDTKGEIYWIDGAEPMRKARVLYNATNNNVFVQAFVAQTLERIVSSTDNPLKPGGGFQITLEPRAEITDNDWFILFEADGVKPFGEVVFDDLTTAQSYEGSGGDFTNDTGEEYVQWESHQGFYCNLPLNLLQVNN